MSATERLLAGEPIPIRELEDEIGDTLDADIAITGRDVVRAMLEARWIMVRDEPGPAGEVMVVTRLSAGSVLSAAET